MAKQPSTTAETVGRNLEIQFSVSGIEQHILARDVGVSSMTITRTLRHHKDTSMTTAKAMADALGIALSDLVDPGYPELVGAMRTAQRANDHVLFESDLTDDCEYEYTANEPLFANIRKSFECRADWLRKQLDERIDRERAKIEGLLTDAIADPENYENQQIIEIDGEVLLGFKDRAGWSGNYQCSPDVLQAARETMAMVAAKKTTNKKRSAKKGRKPKKTTNKKRSAKKRRKTKKTIAHDRR